MCLASPLALSSIPSLWSFFFLQLSGKLKRPFSVAFSLLHPSFAFQETGISSEVSPALHHSSSGFQRDLDDHHASHGRAFPPQDSDVKKPHRHHRGESTALSPAMAVQLPHPSPRPCLPWMLNHPIYLSGTQTKAEEAWPTIKNDASQQTK